jgi:alkanesulfonate monooxygenase SsuD/methylene tetrahydromethanopterin reductase-like flavin-dependent oxidoreductase (luciferase family)
MPIEFGIFDHIEASGDTPAEEIYEHRIAFLKRAEAGGFSAFHLAEHHGHRLSIAPTAAVFLAAIARETTQMKLIPTVVCLPLHDPVRLFEDLAMVDVLSHGRLEIGVGKGITPFEHLQFGHDPAEGSERAADILTMLLRAWETGIMSSEGSKFYNFLELKLPWALKQKPHPPLWTAGNVQAAGSRGHNFVAPFTMTAAVRGMYDELRAASRLQPGHHNPQVIEPKVAQCQGVIIGRTNDEAEAAARRVWTGYAQQLLQAHGVVPPHLQTGISDSADTHLAASQLLRDPVDAAMVVCGDVERVRDYYLQRAREGYANHFVAMLPFGTMTSEETERTLDGFINVIIPAVREFEHERDNAGVLANSGSN